MADVFVTFLSVAFEIISLCTVTEAYDTCYPGYDYSFSFTCYGEDEYCCNNDFDCCRFIATGAIIGIIVGCVVCVGTIITLVCICIRKNRHRPGMVMQQNQQFEVSYIAYNGRTPNNQNIYGQHMVPPRYGPQPPPYGIVQAGYAQPPPYSTVQADSTHLSPSPPQESNLVNS